MGWIGKQMMNPEGKIGNVIEDSNGVFRILTVKFEDNTTEKLWLSNTGSNPIKSRKWKWYYNISKVNPEQIPKWVEWGA